MKKVALLLSIFSLAFFTGAGLNAQVMIGLDILNECEPGLVNLLNSSDIGTTGPAVWTWDINGEIYNDYELIDHPLQPDYYKVTLSLSDDLGFVGSDSVFFEIYADPVRFLVFPGEEACPGEQLQFWVDERVSPTWMQWSFSDNSFPEDDHNSNYVNHTFYEDGIYDVTLVMNHFCGPDTLTRQISVSGT
ncbi:MAG: PKD domain-containing protein, partial [Bacteroidales bacterium]|nr:PKD domain-containing protein [Bacteroidales bacterium]